MTLALLFWIIMLFALLGGAWWTRQAGANWQVFGYGWLLFILIVVLGIHAFGWPIKG